MLPNGTMLVTAGGNEVKIWDLLSGGNRLLKTISAHNKTVTNLSLARDQTRLVTTSLDRQLKFHEISTFKTVHSLSLPSPILSAAVAVSLKFNSSFHILLIEGSIFLNLEFHKHYRYIQYANKGPSPMSYRCSRTSCQDYTQCW